MEEQKTEELKEVLTNAKLIKQKKELLKEQVKQLDIKENMTAAELVENFKDTSIQARTLGACAAVYEKMLADKDRPVILLGLAGSMIAAGLRKIIRDMIKNGLVDVVVSTGAILYQDVYQSRGFKHYVGSPYADDGVLRELYIDRIYDTYVDEEKFWETDLWIGRFADKMPKGNVSSRQFLEALGKELNDDNSILTTAAKLGVPVFCPAINDSSIGIGLTNHFHRNFTAKKQMMTISSIQDNYELTQIVVKAKATSAIYIGGGVPKNYINDSVIMAYIFGLETGGHRYAWQITTDTTHWGNLGASTLSEAVSWGKVNKEADNAMCFVDMSIGLPLVYSNILSKGLHKSRKRIKLKWDGFVLREIGFE